MIAPSAEHQLGWEPEDPQRPAAASVVFLLVLALSVPFYLIGLTGWRLPGLPILPLRALMGFVPMAAAMILVAWSGGRSAMIGLLTRLLHPIRRTKWMWLGVAVLFMPLVCLIEYAARLQRGEALPSISFDASNVVFRFAAFFVGALGEELGCRRPVLLS